MSLMFLNYTAAITIAYCLGIFDVRARPTKSDVCFIGVRYADLIPVLTYYHANTAPLHYIPAH